MTAATVGMLLESLWFFFHRNDAHKIKLNLYAFLDYTASGTYIAVFI